MSEMHTIWIYRKAAHFSFSNDAPAHTHRPAMLKCIIHYRKMVLNCRVTLKLQRYQTVHLFILAFMHYALIYLHSLLTDTLKHILT